MRTYLGADPNAPISHPSIVSGFGHRVMGLTVPRAKGVVAATIVPSVGCPMGCNFCTTSSFFGGKGKIQNFFETGEELYQVMSHAEKELGVSSFFIMDENFLLQKPRAMELLELMKRDGKAWSLYVFSSANAIRKYSMEELIDLGVSWIWMGLESPRSSYSKLNGADTLTLTNELREHGIRVLGSTIVGLEHHTPGNIGGRSSTPSRTTPISTSSCSTLRCPELRSMRRSATEGRLLDVDLADIHGQFKFNFKHNAISRDESKSCLDWAFWRDFERKLAQPVPANPHDGGGLETLPGQSQSADSGAVRAGAQGSGGQLCCRPVGDEAVLHRSNAKVSARVREVRLELNRELGGLRRAYNRLIGPVVLWAARREARRFPHGRIIEPPTSIVRRNWNTV